ncbi:hypothetical protein PBI_PAEDORE_45 [Streptomyces phage Paedore]|uniref:Uncharacterized protein n=1 Tax=Streptomyces phage Paedore TaxID=2108134 RepID=A0A2P1JTR0_9CAUD|nr:hypothetical protein KGG91_gp45 [Streptomyces phage Paedore]AVO22528.1 hypothetical protein PBI_PAEDORE_45 [Streptomyces phage Paedore]
MNIIEITNAYDSAEEARADWSFVETGIYDRPIEAAARAVSRDRGGVVEFDDMKQEAIIYAASRSAEMRRYHRPDGTVDEGKLYKRLYSRLLNKTEREAGHAAKRTSYEANLEALGEGA